MTHIESDYSIRSGTAADAAYLAWKTDGMLDVESLRAQSRENPQIGSMTTYGARQALKALEDYGFIEKDSEGYFPESGESLLEPESGNTGALSEPLRAFTLIGDMQEELKFMEPEGSLNTVASDRSTSIEGYSADTNPYTADEILDEDRDPL